MLASSWKPTMVESNYLHILPDGISWVWLDQCQSKEAGLLQQACSSVSTITVKRSCQDKWIWGCLWTKLSSYNCQPHSYIFTRVSKLRSPSFAIFLYVVLFLRRTSGSLAKFQCVHHWNFHHGCLNSYTAEFIFRVKSEGIIKINYNPRL